jgi:membrane protein DedA with SNARE-associated domain
MESLQYLDEYRQFACLALIFLMTAESAPVIGFFIPGALILPALGAMTASGDWPFWSMYACALSGALLGDISGFWLGRAGAAEWSGRLFSQHRQRAMKAARKLVMERGAMAIFFQPLYPRWPRSEVPVGHVTNGVHVPSWDSAVADALWTESCGACSAVAIVRSSW